MNRSQEYLEQELDHLIDTINQERSPEQISEENADMPALIRAVRSLRRPVKPEDNLLGKIYQIAGVGSIEPSRKQGPVRYGTIAAGIVLVVAITVLSSLLNQNIARAMEKAVQELQSYHGRLEVVARNAAGEVWMVRELEIWVEGNRYVLRQNDGTIIVNNNEQKWQLNEGRQEIVLLPLAPDYTGKGFDLRDEAAKAKQYPLAEEGREMIAGREAIRLKISPPGGDPHYLWVDAETDLPLQLQTPVQNALQTTYTFVEFEPNIPIDPLLFTYQVPAGYRVIKNDPGQIVTTVQEAAAISGLTPLLPKDAPQRIIAFRERLVYDYGDSYLMFQPAHGPFAPSVQGALGDVAGEALEIVGERLRWRQQGLEIIAEGPRSMQLAVQLAPFLNLPDQHANLSGNAKISFPVDLEIVEAEQKQADGGHSPWQLDPLQVALTFVNLQVTPGGIVGEPQIPYAEFKIKKNTGREATVIVGKGPISRVYLKRLLRTDETGIWTVVGYDPN